MNFLFITFLLITTVRVVVGVTSTNARAGARNKTGATIRIIVSVVMFVVVQLGHR